MKVSAAAFKPPCNLFTATELSVKRNGTIATSEWNNSTTQKRKRCDHTGIKLPSDIRRAHRFIKLECFLAAHIAPGALGCNVNPIEANESCFSLSRKFFIEFFSRIRKLECQPLTAAFSLHTSASHGYKVGRKKAFVIPTPNIHEDRPPSRTSARPTDIHTYWNGALRLAYVLVIRFSCVYLVPHWPYTGAFSFGFLSGDFGSRAAAAWSHQNDQHALLTFLFDGAPRVTLATPWENKLFEKQTGCIYWPNSSYPLAALRMIQQAISASRQRALKRKRRQHTKKNRSSPLSRRLLNRILV